MAKQIAIVGAGIIGRILALECQLAGMSVSLFDRDNKEGQLSCAYTGAGMLAPYTELETAEPIIAALGIDSLTLWPGLLKKLPEHVFFQQNGSLILAHPQDQPDLDRFQRSVQFKLDKTKYQERKENHTDRPNPYRMCDRNQIFDLEPELSPLFSQGIYLPAEGQIDNRQILHALGSALVQANVNWQTGVEVLSLAPHRIRYIEGQQKGVMANQQNITAKSFDLVIDCRGLGGKPDLNQLRGVRGELLLVEAAGVKLNRPIRLMHPRHSIYIVPRENNRFLIGATSIESEDMRPLTVQSALELLLAACTVHPEFAEGIILESRVNCRPALPDNLPAIILLSEEESRPVDGGTLNFSGQTAGLIRINGLYRHGFLISPKLARLVFAYIMGNTIAANYAQIFHTEIFSSEVSCTKELDLYNEVVSFAASH